MKRLFVTLVAVGLLGALTAGPVAAAPASFTHATGSVALSGPQYVSFNAFDYGATGDRGTVNYTNFAYPVAGTGVWNVSGWSSLDFLGGAYQHAVTVATVTPISTTATKFSGTGYWKGDPAYTWTIKGMVSGSNVSFHIVYTGTGAGYFVDGAGVIAPDGSMSGNATDSSLQALPWTAPAGSAYEVFSYTASVYCAVIGGTDAIFGFVIPAGTPLAGVPVVVNVHDGGTPGTNGDTWGHGVGTCGDAVGNYPITSGNLVVH